MVGSETRVEVRLLKHVPQAMVRWSHYAGFAKSLTRFDVTDAGLEVFEEALQIHVYNERGIWDTYAVRIPAEVGLQIIEALGKVEKRDERGVGEQFGAGAAEEIVGGA